MIPDLGGSAKIPDVVSGNAFDKYGSQNPIVQLLMAGFFGAFYSMVQDLPVKSILEIGCGEGEIGQRLKNLFPKAHYLGTDISDDIVSEARKRHPDLRFDTISIYDLHHHDMKPDLVVASEVFEHLDDPARGLAGICQLPFQHLLLSVPREPVWRLLNIARGKYLSQLGNTPGHLNHWSSRDFIRFIKEFRNSLEIIAVRHPFPWTLVLCRKIHGSHGSKTD